VIPFVLNSKLNAFIFQLGGVDGFFTDRVEELVELKRSRLNRGQLEAEYFLGCVDLRFRAL